MKTTADAVDSPAWKHRHLYVPCGRTPALESAVPAAAHINGSDMRASTGRVGSLSCVKGGRLAWNQCWRAGR